MNVTDAYRAILLTNDTQLISNQHENTPIWWFENMTEKIDLQREAEKAMLAEMTTVAQSIRLDAIAQVVAASIILSVTILATIIVLIYVLRALHGRVQIEQALHRFLPSEFVKLLGSDVCVS